MTVSALRHIRGYREALDVMGPGSHKTMCPSVNSYWWICYSASPHSWYWRLNDGGNKQKSHSSGAGIQVGAKTQCTT